MTDSRIAIVDRIYDSDRSEEPFGKRWRDECVTLDAATLAALLQGKILALDVQGEYVIYVRAGEMAGPAGGNPPADSDDARAAGRGSD
ncbi:hypothetical protein [uncultured Thiodictyon sp.]|jgi:hypothetical protein|uniref:hypothetical protein n=1 Tax=uncultured Thiodictyon sp. TaxID=1846217 RepID=UPI0025D9EDCB|nr:hypothetical protein [uncultured Thiodictyon sp.]